MLAHAANGWLGFALPNNLEKLGISSHLHRFPSWAPIGMPAELYDASLTSAPQDARKLQWMATSTYLGLFTT